MLRSHLFRSILAIMFLCPLVMAQWAPDPIAGGGLITKITSTSVTITRGGVAKTVTIDANTVIKIDNVVKTAADLKEGLYAGAWGTGEQAGEIRAFTPKAPAATQPAAPAPSPAPAGTQIAGGGLITDLTSTSVTITRGNVAKTVTIDASTIIKIDNVVKTAADLKKGMYAGAWGKDSLATEIRAYTPKPAK